MHFTVLLLRIYKMGQLSRQSASTLLVIVIFVSQTQKIVCSSSDDNVELGSGIDIDLAITINVAHIQFVEEVDNELPSVGTAQGDENENWNSSVGRIFGPDASGQKNSGAILGVSALLWTTLYSVFLILQLSR